MFVINPNEFIIPFFGVVPFRTEYVAINHLLTEDEFYKEYLNKHFGNENWIITSSGSEAIKIALEKYNLLKNDVVTILTTSENFYISSCVTKEIDRVCIWNRDIVPETKIIFVNHEFGYPHPDIERLIGLGLPIIEDCCATFFSQNETEKVGKYGDFTVYSLPKFFPIQLGGILVSNKGKLNEVSQILKENELQYIKNVLSYNFKDESNIIKIRKENFDYGLSLFTQLGFSERFERNEKIVPYAMLLNNNNIVKNLYEFKLYLSRNGIQSSLFYGEDAFFIPNHQNLSKMEIDFLFQIILYYIKNQ